ncbi:ImmA/IrrE family metallo-endopeptidase [Solwaraspora sp. WMMD1047]|uniref:ImmA/IrrE family metallo-endopeptidase n=1 Tax=Solwaraspora sp. WMMD1047 TaxID=3016102 RepID=UPI00241747E4|nr:ImmA/IrrE family metallo-endopeptidase [Solwaraspora sp. WMMD1047]MDG4830873.1 ImmA/IrrE family metallo-endopeptidase [Solwaraspora sp. WMMD1047]
MNLARLRQICLARLAELRDQGLRIPTPFDAAALCARVGDCLGQPIRLVGVPMPAGAPFGLTLFTDNGHIIAYEQGTSRVHQDHIIAHELGHVLLDHRSYAVDDETAAQLLMPTLRPAMVHQVLNRTGAYSRQEEQEAEMMATILLEEASRREEARRSVSTGGDGLSETDAALYARLRHGLEQPHH